jgi:hypothetical protein
MHADVVTRILLQRPRDDVILHSFLQTRLDDTRGGKVSGSLEPALPLLGLGIKCQPLSVD